MNRKRIITVIVSVLLLFLIVGGIYYLFQRNQTLITQDGDVTEITNPYGQPAQIASETRSYQLSPDGHHFFFQGKFISPLTTLEGYVIGDFVLDDDPSQTPIRVIFVPPASNMYYGENNGGTTTFLPITGQELMSKIEPGKLYEVRTTVSANNQNSPQAALLQNLLTDQDITNQEYGFFAAAVRNLE